VPVVESQTLGHPASPRYRAEQYQPITERDYNENRPEALLPPLATARYEHPGYNVPLQLGGRRGSGEGGMHRRGEEPHGTAAATLPARASEAAGARLGKEQQGTQQPARKEGTHDAGA